MTLNEFIKVLTTVAVTANKYCDLVSTWKGKQAFVKKESKMHKVHHDMLKVLKKIKKLCSMKIVSSNLTAQLKSCQEKTEQDYFHQCCQSFLTQKGFWRMHAIPLLQGCIAQRQRNFNKLTGSKEYMFSANNSVSPTWDVAVDKIYEAELLGNNSLSPLNGQQLAHHLKISATEVDWLVDIPDYVIRHEYDLDKNMKDAVSQVIHQLEEHFPVVCIKSGQRSVLIDYTEMVFKPR